MRVILLVGSRNHTLASIFLKSLNAIGETIDEVILCDGVLPLSQRIFSYLNLNKIVSHIQGKVVTWLRKVYLKNNPSLQTYQGLFDRWSPRGENSWDLFTEFTYDVIQYVMDQKIPVRHFSSINGVPLKSYLKGLGKAAVICYGGGILKKELFKELPEIIFVNSHMAKVPPFRGMNVAEWSVMSGEGLEVTVMAMNSGIDTGPILYRMPYEANEARTTADLRKAGYLATCKAMSEIVPMLRQEQFTPLAQEKEQGKPHYCMHTELKDQVARKLMKGINAH